MPRPPAEAPKHPACTSYLAHCQRLNQTANTLAKKRCYLRHLERWLQGQGLSSPLEASPAMLESFVCYLSTEYLSLHSKPLGKCSLFSYVGLLIDLYDFLARERLLLTSPAKGLQHPRQAKRLPMDVLSPVEFKWLLLRLSADTPSKLRDAVALRILMFSGMRLDELCCLCVDDLNLRDRELLIRQGKGKKDRIAFIDRSTQQWLAQYLVSARPQLAKSSCKRLLLMDNGEPISHYWVRCCIKSYLTKCRITKHVTPHSFRRTLCSLLLQSGLNIKVISEIVGHSRLSTTARYTEIDTETLTRIYQQGHPFA